MLCSLCINTDLSICSNILHITSWFHIQGHYISEVCFLLFTYSYQYISIPSQTTIEPPRKSTTEANNENTTTNVTGDKCSGINCGNNMLGHPLKMMSVFIKSTLLIINNTLLKFLKTLNSTSNFMLHAMMQPVSIIYLTKSNFTFLFPFFQYQDLIFKL